VKKDSLAHMLCLENLISSSLHACYHLGNFSESVVCVPGVESGMCLLVSLLFLQSFHPDPLSNRSAVLGMEISFTKHSCEGHSPLTMYLTHLLYAVVRKCKCTQGDASSCLGASLSHQKIFLSHVCKEVFIVPSSSQPCRFHKPEMTGRAFATLFPVIPFLLVIILATQGGLHYSVHLPLGEKKLVKIATLDG